MYTDSKTRANSVDTDQTPQNAASDLCTHCLLLIQQFLDTSIGGEMGMFKFQDNYLKVSE